MFGLSEFSAFWLAAMVQGMGIASLILTRLNGIGPLSTWRQASFYITLAVVGLLLLATVFTGSGFWLSFAITTAIMVVGAVIDFGAERCLRAV